MRALSLRSWLALSHGAVLALPLLALLLTGALTRELELEARGQLLQQGQAVAALAGARVASGEPAQLAALSKELTRLGQATRTRLRIRGPDGVELVASRVAEPPGGAPPAGEPVTVSLPLGHRGEALGSVELSMAPRHPLVAMRLARDRLLLVGGLCLAGALLLALALAHGISRPLRRLATLARGMVAAPPERLADLAAGQGSRLREVGWLAGELAQVSARLQARLAYAGELASNVSHELRNPVTTLRSSLELLRDERSLPDELRAKLLEGGLEELARMDATIGGLLALARAEEGGRREPLSLDAALEALAERHPGLPIEGCGGTILVDPALLATALDNLLRNAHQHGGPTVSVRAWLEGERTGVTVIDDGPGIPPERQARIFERFHTTAADRGGTGLGLAIVKAVVEASGGEVAVESRPGETRFLLEWRG